MAKPKLHLDADASRKDLANALIARGHDVTRTPTEYLSMDASDEYQLLWATAQARILFTYNIGDYLRLAEKYPEHSRIILAPQKKSTIHQLITLLDRMLRQVNAEDLNGQIRWLSDWK